MLSITWNKQGNRWDSRDYGTGGNPYHYSNKDRSWYYNNPDGSKYYHDGRGLVVYTAPGGQRYYKHDYVHERQDVSHDNQGSGRAAANHANSTRTSDITDKYSREASYVPRHYPSRASGHIYDYSYSSTGFGGDACSGSNKSRGTPGTTGMSLHRSGSDDSKAPTGHHIAPQEYIDGNGRYGIEYHHDEHHNDEDAESSVDHESDSEACADFYSGGLDDGHDDDGGHDDYSSDDDSDEYSDYDAYDDGD